MDASIAALLGALIGSLAGVVTQVVTVSAASRNERRRLALDTGYREWEQMIKYAQATGTMEVFPPALFIYYNLELLNLIDSRRGVTPEGYRELTRRHEQIRAVIKEDSDLRQGKRGQ
jgi:hypothetical protein